jgi:hypothetical protein
MRRDGSIPTTESSPAWATAQPAVAAADVQDASPCKRWEKVGEGRRDRRLVQSLADIAQLLVAVEELRIVVNVLHGSRARVPAG